MNYPPRGTPDYVVSKKEAAQITNVSIFTLDRLAAKSDGPCRLKLSPRRVGYRMSDLQAWLRSREMIAG